MGKLYYGIGRMKMVVRMNNSRIESGRNQMVSNIRDA